MRKTAAWLVAVFALIAAAPAAAEVRSVKICDGKTLAASNANLYGLGNGITDCAYTDISGFKFFSWQASCTDAGDSAVSVSFDWLGGSGASSAYLGIPLNTAGTAMSQLRTAWTTETTYTTLQSLQPPVSPIGTIRITNGETDTDVTCTVILNMGN